MKRKLFIFVLALFIPCMLVLSACKQNEQPPAPTALTSEMITLSQVLYHYDGTAKQPTVTVEIEENVISSNEYTVSYSNNINVGEATATVTAKSDSEVISGSASVTFTIRAIDSNVSSYDELKTILQNSNNQLVELNDDLVIPEGETLTIASGVRLNLGDHNLVVNGTLVNNGTIAVNVNSVESLKAAYEYANEINLTADILSTDSYIGDISLVATNRDYDITINLNGKTIEAELDFVNFVSGSELKNNAVYTEHSINVTINGFRGTIGGRYNDYGVLVKGNSNVSVTLDSCYLIGTDGGIYTNGRCKGAVITATNCEFTGTNLDDVEFGDSDGASGAYLAGSGTYNFTSCVFTGLTGYYAKSGSHSLTACEVIATAKTYAEPAHNSNGCNETGSALVLDSAAGYQSPLEVEIVGGEFTSEAGYGIEIYTTGDTAPYSSYTVLNPTYSAPKGNLFNWNE